MNEKTKLEYETPTDPTAQAVGRVEIIISTLLRAGVITSLTVIFIGMALSYFHHPDLVRDPKQLTVLTATSAAFPHSVRGVLGGALGLHGQAVMMLGLLILIATPVFRVAVSIIAFAVQHDGTYVLITCAVLMILILSFLIGHAKE